MKNFKSKIISIMPHITIILSCMFLIFWFLDILNPVMNFVNSKISNKLLLLFCISSIITLVIAAWYDRNSTDDN